LGEPYRVYFQDIGGTAVLLIWRHAGTKDTVRLSLLLLTNDGEFAHAVLHPSKKIPKTYLVKIKGNLEDESIEKLRKGIRLDRTVTAPAKVKRLRKTESNSWIEMVIYEGKKRQIRRMLERVGHSLSD
jgi:23S rRNA pseudouridine2605 synthase